MYYQALGPLLVTRDDGTTVPIRQAKQRSLLCLLVSRAGRAVRTEDLIDALWGDDPPLRAERTLHTHIWAIRRHLQSGTLLHNNPHCYVLNATGQEVDILQFRALAARGKRMQLSGDLVTAAHLYQKALDLWREPAVIDFPPTILGTAESQSLIEERLVVIEALLEARLDLGEHKFVIPQLQSLTLTHPLRENFWAHLMIALSRSGRRPDALNTYARAWKIIAQEIGVEPTRALQKLHHRILNDSLDSDDT